MIATIRWEARLEYVATIDVDELDIARWAIEHTAITRLVGGQKAEPSAEELRNAMKRNPHLQSRIAQLYAVAHRQDTRLEQTRRDNQPKTQN